MYIHLGPKQVVAMASGYHSTNLNTENKIAYVLIVVSSYTYSKYTIGLLKATKLHALLDFVLSQAYCGST